MNCLSAAWRAHEAELRRWVRHRLHDPVQADDLVQDVFLKALRQGERFCALHNPRAWLFEVARNLLIDRFRMARDTVALPDDLQGMAQADFARARGLSLSAAKSRLQRARQRLKARMTQVCQVRLEDAGHVADFVPRP